MWRRSHGGLRMVFLYQRLILSESFERRRQHWLTTVSLLASCIRLTYSHCSYRATLVLWCRSLMPMLVCSSCHFHSSKNTTLLHSSLLPINTHHSRVTCKTSVVKEGRPWHLSRVSQLHHDRKKRPPKQNAVKCTIYNTIQWHLHSII